MIEHSTRAHAKLSASGSAKWMGCSGSVAAEAMYKVDKTNNVFAEEGTAAHELSEKCFAKGIGAETFIGETFNGFVVDADMAHHVNKYVDYVNDLLLDDSRLIIEKRVAFTDYVPEGFGTADVVIIQTDGTIHVCDLKYGQGVEVSAVENTQGQLYALGVYQEYGAFVDIKQVNIHIIQPRKHNYSEWSITEEGLLAFGEYVRERATAALTPNAPRTPSEKSCQWCVHKANCVELADHTASITQGYFEVLADEIPKLSDARKALILQNKGLIESFLKAVEQSVFDDIMSGKEVMGYKVVEGRSTRKWTPEAEAELVAQLGDKAYSKSLIGVTEAQKQLGKKVVDELTAKAEGRPTLAVESDKRKSISKIFEDIS